MDKLNLSRAPWLFIHDPTSTAAFASKLTQLIPSSIHVGVSQRDSEHDVGHTCLTYSDSKYHQKVIIFSHDKYDQVTSTEQLPLRLREKAIENACNFASINLYYDSKDKRQGKWGANHKDIRITSRSTDLDTPEVKNIADQIYQWLFSVLRVKETLHLIPDEKMRHADVKDNYDSHFQEYEYVTISELRKKPKDAKTKVVALILSQPIVSRGKSLTWQVADKTGVANFYFKHRGPTSDFTWDWCLSLQAGQRRTLPIMPCVKVKESVLVSAVKLPFRATGTVVGGTGCLVTSVGRGLCAIGKGLKMGQRTKWVSEASYEKNRTGNSVKPKKTEDDTSAQTTTEKDGEVWNDDDSVVSTTAGSVFDEKNDLS